MHKGASLFPTDSKTGSITSVYVFFVFIKLKTMLHSLGGMFDTLN